jgi:hypothetical protein
MRPHPAARLRCTWSIRDRPQVSCRNNHSVPVVALQGAGREDLLTHAQRQRHVRDGPPHGYAMALAECSIAASGDDKH